MEAGRHPTGRGMCWGRVQRWGARAHAAGVKAGQLDALDILKGRPGEGAFPCMQLAGGAHGREPSHACSSRGGSHSPGAQEEPSGRLRALAVSLAAFLGRATVRAGREPKPLEPARERATGERAVGLAVDQKSRLLVWRL